MKLQFKVQSYQTFAVDAVVDCFAGQLHDDGLSYRIDPGQRVKSIQPTFDIPVIWPTIAISS